MNNMRNENEMVDRLRGKIRGLKKENRHLGYIIIGCIVMVVIQFGIIGFMGFSNSINTANLTARIDELESENYALAMKNDSITTENNLLKTEAEIMCDQYDSLALLLTDVSSLAVVLDEEVTELANAGKSLEEELKELRSRKELYDSYEWAIMRENDTRTDIKYEDIKHIQDIVDEKGMNPETVDLVLAIAMTESNGVKTARSKKSTATGLGQFLSGTGEFVYTKLMGNSNYNHYATATDSTTNLEMMVEYLDYLDKSTNHNTNKVISRYRGFDSKEYKEKVNSYLKKNDLEIRSLSIN